MRNRHSSHPVNPFIGVQTIIAATLALAIIFTLSCSQDNIGDGSLVGNSGTFTDDRDGGKVYKWVKIGEQYWMAENLNYKAESSKCYGEGGQVYDYDEETDTGIYTTLSNAEVQANCDKYGRLYDWATAMALPSNCNSTSCASQIKPKHKGICPSGWHISTYVELKGLSNYVQSDKGCSDCDAKYLKSTSGWKWNYDDNISGNGEDAYGFSALPSGRGSSDGNFGDVGRYGRWWSTWENNASEAASWKMRHYSESGNWDSSSKRLLHSVRCLKD
jgi:uncharacterized protein (TIGR02145 family)